MKKSIVFRQPGTPTESVHVGLDMSGYYKEFINAIPDGAKDREEQFKNGVACIVWGSFYLESAINDTVVKILEDGTTGMLQGEEMVWPLLEKVKTEQKFELVLAALMPDDEKKRGYSKSVAAIFKLRNRLAHFKEPLKEVESWRIRPKHEAEKVQAQVDAAKMTTPNIIDAILSASVKERRTVILEIGSWVECAIFDYYKRKELPHA